ncbi:MAG: branched-chain amino acid ABC transporter ATP-binding protein [Desulfobacterium sp. 4572_20]|nr:MAG: branched-chain amino acid ABC transporter ATP-binding protein [Desulfobacterium sp. 4572_20]
MIEITQISAGYGEFQALFDISFSVKKGTTAIIVGPNGAGKSTLLNCISGLLTVSSGSIYFDGISTHNLKPHKIVEMGIVSVPEGDRLFPYLSVEENLKMGSFPRRARKAFKNNLKWVYDLYPILLRRKRQLAGLLSGGERRMLAIGRALMASPRVILFDEPSLGLAPLIVKNVFELIKQINATGYTILLVEQNAKKAISLADNAFLLESGRIKLKGSKEDFLSNDHIKKAYIGL